MNQLSQTYEFMTARLQGSARRRFARVEQLEWLLPMATRLVEREARRRAISERQLFQRRHEVEDPAVQYALDILEAGGFIEPVSAE